MKRLAILFLLSVLVITACVPTIEPLGAAPTKAGPASKPGAIVQPHGLVVLADSSLGNLFAQLASEVMDAHPGLVVEVRYGDSLALRKEIENGTQADVVALADPNEMDALAAGKYVDPQAAGIFLVNQLTVVLPGLNKAGLASLRDLTKPGVRVALAGKDTLLGQLSLQAIDNLDKSMGAGYKEKLLGNVTFMPDAVGVLSVVANGSADAGIVFTSDRASAPAIMTIPAESNVITQYSLAVLLGAADKPNAQVFVDYVLSPQGQAAIRTWGFLQDR